jgi:hypothetical protein
MGSQMSVNDPTGRHQVQKTWRRNVARALACRRDFSPAFPTTSGLVFWSRATAKIGRPTKTGLLLHVHEEEHEVTGVL